MEMIQKGIPKLIEHILELSQEIARELTFDLALSLECLAKQNGVKGAANFGWGRSQFLEERSEWASSTKQG